MQNVIGQAVNTAVKAIKTGTTVHPLAEVKPQDQGPKPGCKKPIQDASFISPKLERCRCATQGVHGKVKVDKAGNVTLTDKTGRSYQITDPKELVGQLRRAVDAVKPGTPVTAHITGDLTQAHVALDKLGRKQFVPDRISASGVEITSEPRQQKDTVVERAAKAVADAVGAAAGLLGQK